MRKEWEERDIMLLELGLRGMVLAYHPIRVDLCLVIGGVFRVKTLEGGGDWVKLVQRKSCVPDEALSC